MVGNATQRRLENLREKENLEDLGENGSVVMNNEKTGHTLLSSNSMGGQAEIYFEHNKEIKFSIYLLHTPYSLHGAQSLRS